MNANSQLSDEQILMRETGIGASEIAAVCGVSPFPNSTQLDVWMRKRTPTRGPLITTQLEGKPIEMGNLLEDPYRAKYAEKMGVNAIKPPDSYRHPKYHFMLATPDGICWNDGSKNIHPMLGIPFDYGLEIKNVGARMIGAWESGVPEYTQLQCVGNMSVFDIGRWDVFVGLGGSDYEMYQLQRDMELEETVIEACRFFWESYILTDTPPPTDDPDKQRELLKALFPGREGKECIPPEDVTGFYDLCGELEKIKATEKVLSAEKTELENQIIEMVGDNYGIEYDGYKFTWGTQSGSTSYKAIAEDLAGGKIDTSMIEKHRGAAKRVARFTTKKESK